MAQDVVSDVIINYKSVGLDKVGQEIKQTSVALDGLVIASTNAEKATASLEGRFKGLERSLGTTEGQAAKFAKVQDTVNKAVGQNPALMERGNQILATAAERYGMVATATGKSADSTKLARYEVINLGRQLQDVAVSLQGGQGFGTVLLQQGSQISDVFTSTSATLAGVKAQIGGAATAAAAMVTPMAALGGAMAVFDGVAIAAGIHWASAQKDVENALKGIGRQSGATVSDINRIAEATSRTTNLTIGSAREFATTFAATGKIGKDNIALATQAVDGLAQSLGVSGADAAKTFASALADPAKGLGELEALTGAYDLKTQELIKSLIRQGEVERARTVLIEGAAAATKDAAEQSGFWANRLKDIKNGFDLIGGDLVKGAELVRHDVGGAVPTTGVSRRDRLATAQADLSRQQAMPASAFNFDAQTTQAYYDQLSKLTDQVQKLKAAVAGDELAAFNARLKESAGAADAAVQKFMPYDQQIRQVKDSIMAMTKAQDDFKTRGAMVDAASLTPAIEGAKVLVRTLEDAKNTTIAHNQYLTEMGQKYKDIGLDVAKQVEEMEDQLRIVKARGEYEKEAAQRNKDLNDALRGNRTETEAAEIAAGKAALRLAESDNTARRLGSSMNGVAVATQQAADAAHAMNVALENAQRAAQGIDLGRGGTFFGPPGSANTSNVPVGTQYASTNYVAGMNPGNTQFILDTAAKYNIDPNQLISPGAKGFTNFQELAAQETQAAIDAQKDNTSAVDKLKSSTDALNRTNQELLSPYYAQDPRTSHIGFRSQGMAAGGYVDVPGSPSANDNMIAQIPVASGERIYVDPMTVKRGNAGTTINISAPMMFSGPVNRDEVGRTVYQSMQIASRSIAAAQR